MQPNSPSDPISSRCDQARTYTALVTASNGTPSPGNELGVLLQAYFRSGWAFLIPYLVVYLLYAGLKWPVNPATGDGTLYTVFRPLCLLQVYWALHAVHLALGAIALRAWWQSGCHMQDAKDKERSSSQRPLFPVLWSLVPWLCLAAVFWIPGLYLEWPSDPWEHLRRINEWRILDEVTTHSSWKKSSYFLTYSLTKHVTGLAQLSWLNLYSTFVCLLLSWQYYRLARAIGLGDRAAFIFLLLNAFTFGNSVFSFYRYYGLSSSVFAQIGAVALTRLVIEVVSSDTSPATNPPRDSRSVHLGSFGSKLLVASLSASGMVALTFFNHIQGLAIAGLGVMAVIVWRLIRWRRASARMLVLAAVLASLAIVLWFPRHETVDAVFRSKGWLTPWYGFNFFSLESPTVGRSLQILGPIGAMSLAAGLWLVSRNQIAGWLTWMPVMALATPCIGLPFAHFLAASTSSPDSILVFHRLLFAVPTGLTLVTVGQNLVSKSALLTTSTKSRPAARPSPALASIISIALLLSLVLAPVRGSAGRLWQALQRVPDDLQLAHMISLWSDSAPAATDDQDTLVIGEPLGTEIRQVFVPTINRCDSRQIHGATTTDKLAWHLDRIRQAPFLRDSRRSHAQDVANLIPDRTSFPLPIAEPNRSTAAPIKLGSSWDTVAGEAPQPSYSAGGEVILSNPSGATTYLFNSDLIAVDRSKRYRLQVTVRQLGSPAAVNLLAVAWYDQEKRLLEANQPSPGGANWPIGWSNGNYSYYGLVGQPAPSAWSHYETSFGWGEPASIPANAAFVRLGALLNYNGATPARIELRSLTLSVKPPYVRASFAVPNPLRVFSPRSLAAILSGHWSPQKIALEHVGLVELRLAVAEMLYDRVSTVSAPGGG